MKQFDSYSLRQGLADSVLSQIRGIAIYKLGPAARGSLRVREGAKAGL